MAATLPNAEQWSRVKLRLRAELGEDIFNSWFARATFEEADASTVYLSLPTRFLKAWIVSHYEDRLLALWQAEQPSVARIEILVRTAARPKAVVKAEAQEAPAEARPVPAAGRRSAGRAPAAPVVAQPRRAVRHGHDPCRLAGRAALHLRDLLRGRRQSPGLCRRQVGGRGGAGQAGAVQSALHPCRRRPRQDAYPAGDDARGAHRPAGLEGALSDGRALHVPLRGGAEEPVGDLLQGGAARYRPAAHRRHAVPAGQDHPAGILPHAQHADRRRPPGGGRRRPAAGRAGEPRRPRALAARRRHRLRDRRAGHDAAPRHRACALYRRAGAESRASISPTWCSNTSPSRSPPTAATWRARSTAWSPSGSSPASR